MRALPVIPKKSHRSANLFFILVSSLLYAIAFPPLNLWGASFVALAPFFYTLETADSKRLNFLYAALWSVFHGLTMGYWVFLTLVNHYDVPAARAVLFFVMGVIFPLVLVYAGVGACYRFLRQDHILFYAFGVPALWVAAEYLKSLFPFLIPWGGMSDALVPFSSFIQVADIIGGYGVIFLAAAVNALLVYTVRMMALYARQPAAGSPNGQWISALNAVFPVALIFLIVFLPVMYGKQQIRRVTASVEQTKEEGRRACAVLVQGNFSMGERWSGMGFFQRLASYLDMSGVHADRNKQEDKEADIPCPEQVIVWPETTLNSASSLNDAFFLALMRDIGEKTLLISGGLKNDPDHGGVYNSAYFISGKGRLLRYDKHILLPYAETSWFVDFLRAYYTAPDAFLAGRTPAVMKTLNGAIGASICFEILYSGYIRQTVRDGAAVLVNISNDSWFGDSPMPYIHLNAARLRAIENRRFLLRTSNSGISAIIDPVGRITAQSRLFQKERVTGDFVKIDQMSIYSRYGNLAVAASLLVLLVFFVRILMGKD
jgi:apolipoprotein N-acyltransferase